MMELREE